MNLVFANIYARVPLTIQVLKEKLLNEIIIVFLECLKLPKWYLFWAEVQRQTLLFYNFFKGKKYITSVVPFIISEY